MDKFDAIIKKINQLPIHFNIKGTETFSMNGITNEVLILEYNDVEFVFVEGKKDVVLGWDIEKCHLEQNIIEFFEQEYYELKEEIESDYDYVAQHYKKEIKQAYKNNDLDKIKQLEKKRDLDLNLIEKDKNKYKSLDTFKKELNSIINRKDYFSPLRTVDIGDMIVERDNRYIYEDMPSTVEVAKGHKCVRDMTYAEFRNELDKTYFTIATEDEWEYLCGGGTRTFFKWGDCTKEEFEQIVNEIYGVSSCSTNLSKPNMLGVYISYDSYRYELIDSESYVKASDGGSSLCGGAGYIYTLPIYSTFYREPFFVTNDSYLACNFYTYRRIIRL